MTRFVTAVTPLLLVSSAMVLVGRPALAGAPTTLDCFTSYEDSLTLKNQHKLVATRTQLLICSSAPCPADIRTECVERTRAVDAAMPTIVFEAKDAAGADLAHVTVKMDGELLIERLEGNALSVDPGPHTFTFDVAGKLSVQKQLVIVEGQKERRERVVFETAAAVAAAAQIGPAAPRLQAPPSATNPTDASSRIEASLEAAAPPTEDRRSSPVYTRWWFWTAIGVAAAGGVVTALVLSSGSGTPEVSTPPFKTQRADPQPIP
jgi:hypothetical protein